MKMHPPNFDVVIPHVYYIPEQIGWVALFIIGIKVWPKAHRNGEHKFDGQQVKRLTYCARHI
jgi:hypothetical protein